MRELDDAAEARLLVVVRLVVLDLLFSSPQSPFRRTAIQDVRDFIDAFKIQKGSLSDENERKLMRHLRKGHNPATCHFISWSGQERQISAARLLYVYLSIKHTPGLRPGTVLPVRWVNGRLRLQGATTEYASCWLQLDTEVIAIGEPAGETTGLAPFEPPLGEA